MELTAVKEREEETYNSGGGLTVQETAELTGLSEHTLRYYEKIGLISPVNRQSSSKHRRYTSNDILQIRTLACLRAVGMPIEQMRLYFELAKNGKSAAAELKAMLETQKLVLHERVKQMQKNLDYVNFKISFWNAIENEGEEKAKEISRNFHKSFKPDENKSANY